VKYLKLYITKRNVPTWKYTCVIPEQSEFIRYKSNPDLKHQLKLKKNNKKK